MRLGLNEYVSYQKRRLLQRVLAASHVGPWHPMLSNEEPITLIRAKLLTSRTHQACHTISGCFETYLSGRSTIRRVKLSSHGIGALAASFGLAQARSRLNSTLLEIHREGVSRCHSHSRSIVSQRKDSSHGREKRSSLFFFFKKKKNKKKTSSCRRRPLPLPLPLPHRRRRRHHPLELSVKYMDRWMSITYTLPSPWRRRRWWRWQWQQHHCRRRSRPRRRRRRRPRPRPRPCPSCRAI